MPEKTVMPAQAGIQIDIVDKQGRERDFPLHQPSEPSAANRIRIRVPGVAPARCVATVNFMNFKRGGVNEWQLSL